MTSFQPPLRDTRLGPADPRSRAVEPMPQTSSIRNQACPPRQSGAQVNRQNECSWPSLLLLLLLSLGLVACGDSASPPSYQASHETGAHQVPLQGWPSYFSELANLDQGKGTEGLSPVLVGRQGWLYFRPELRHLSLGDYWGEQAAQVSRADAALADPMAAILDFHRQLQELDIGLLFVPVPAKGAVYPQYLPQLPPSNSDPMTTTFVATPEARPDPADRRFLDALQGQGVQVLDLLPVFLRAAEEQPERRLYCKQDTHWSSYGSRLAAREISQALASLLVELPTQQQAGENSLELEESARRTSLRGDLWRQLPEPRPELEEMELISVGIPGSRGLEPVEPSRQSPVLLLGDSHTLVFHAGGDLHARASGLPDHLALELGQAVDLIGVRGSGATASRMSLLRRGDALNGKQVVVWVLSIRETTEGQGWQVLPVRPPT